MTGHRFFRIAVLAFGLITAVPFAASAGRVTVFAAASLTNAMQRIGVAFERDRGHQVVFSFAGSSVLARQIEYGAPAEVYISANPGWMDHLEDKELIAANSRFDLVGNRLVLIAHDVQPEVTLSGQLDLAAMLGEGRLAMALTDAVPAGIYGKAALSALGLWDDVAMRVAQADNVRAALALVATGEAPLGVVYATDAHASDDVSIIATFPPDSYPKILYPAAAVAPGTAPVAGAFLDYLKSPAAQTILAEEGFLALTDLSR